jgi:flagellar biosynthetic protein FliR
VVASVAWHVAMGIVGKLVPRLQTNFATAPGQVLGGLILLGLLVTGLMGAWGEALEAAWSALPGAG